MDRIETMEESGKKIFYYNLSDIKNNEELCRVIADAKEAISACEPKSVYTITNISRISFDTQTKEIAADWMAFNKPYVLHSSFIGVTGVRKIMMSAVFAMSGRSNVKLFHDMREALDWIATL